MAKKATAVVIPIGTSIGTPDQLPAIPACRLSGTAKVAEGAKGAVLVKHRITRSLSYELGAQLVGDVEMCLTTHEWSWKCGRQYKITLTR